jgi:uncharacterized protein (TIGR02117 family)
MKVITRRIHYLVGVFLLLLAFPFLGFIIPRKGSYAPKESCDYKVCVVRFGYHSQILLPVQTRIFDWRDYLNLDHSTNTTPNYGYLGFGWGERNWYINPPRELGQQISYGSRALFLPNSSILRVEKYPDLPQDYETKCVGISSENYLELVEFIQNSFQRNRQGKKLKIAKDLHGQSNFYRAKGTYSLLNNSNHWTARGLQSCGLNTPLWAGHSIAIMWHLPNTC